MSKQDINAVDKDIEVLLKDCLSRELLKKKLNSCSRNSRSQSLSEYVGVPLFSMIVGSGGILKMNTTGRYAYETKGTSIEIFADRCSKKWGLTDIQYMLLIDYFVRRYRGKPGISYGMYVTKQVPYPVESPSTYRDVLTMCHSVLLKLDCIKKGLPLNFIISKQLANLILLKSLFNTLKEI